MSLTLPRPRSATEVGSFSDLSLRSSTLNALAAMGITEPTIIQARALPALLTGSDVIGQARTGSGKTLAFLIPAIELVDADCPSVQVLILTPTRELATQIDSVLMQLVHDHEIRTALIFGGRSSGPQISALRHGAQIVIGTPGRVLDLLNQRELRLERLRFLVLDEADEMLDRGFAPDVERILSATPRDRQTALFSATIPDWVSQTAERHLDRPVTIAVDTRKSDVPLIDHLVFDVQDGDKVAALKDLLDHRGAGSIIVFGRTKHGVKKLARQLEREGYPIGALQGNLSQNARDRVMEQFRSGEIRILLATNVAARGLDISTVDQVINLELPESPELMTHRIGRTGRMGRRGSAITLLAPGDHAKWRDIERALGRRISRSAWRGAAALGFNTDTPGISSEPEAKIGAPVIERRTASASVPGHAKSRGSQLERRVGLDQPGRLIWADGSPIAARSSHHVGTTHADRTAITCSGCGKPSEVPFTPDPTRPVYCADCHRARRQRRQAR